MQGHNKRIRIHTMLDRVKTYSATSYYVGNDCLEIVGKNEQSGVEGEFNYPLRNIEHFNVIEKDIDVSLFTKSEEE